MSATVSPRRTPRSCRPRATACTRSSSSAQVSETLSSTVRTATISGCAAAVRRSASVIVGASTAGAPGRVIVLLSIAASPSWTGVILLMDVEALAGERRDVVAQPDDEDQDDQREPDHAGALHHLERDPLSAHLLDH